MAGEVVEAHGVRLLDEQAEQALALGQVTDPGDRRLVHADVDELVEAHPAGRDDAQGAVLRVRQGDGGLDDTSQHGRQVEVRDDRAVRLEQSTQPVLGDLGITGALDQLPPELVESQLRLVAMTRASVGHLWTIPAAARLPIT